MTSILQGSGAAPTVAISGSNTEFSTYAPQCVQEDSFGDVTVVGSPGSRQAGAILYFTSGGFAPGGNLTPDAVITGTNTQLVNPVGCAFDASGNLWIANDDNFNYSVVMFSSAQLSAGGNVAPARVIQPVTCCGNSSLCNTVSMTFDPSGNLWTGSLCAPTAEFSAASIQSSGSPFPVAWFGQAAGVSSLRFDSGGNLWTSLGSPVSQITEFYASSLPAASSGSLTADKTITSAMMLNPYGIDFDSSGNLWVADQFAGMVFEFAAPGVRAGGAVTPSAIVSGQSTTLSGPTNAQFFQMPRIGVSRRRR